MTTFMQKTQVFVNILCSFHFNKRLTQFISPRYKIITHTQRCTGIDCGQCHKNLLSVTVVVVVVIFDMMCIVHFHLFGSCLIKETYYLTDSHLAKEKVDWYSKFSEIFTKQNNEYSNEFSEFSSEGKIRGNYYTFIRDKSNDWLDIM